MTDNIGQINELLYLETIPPNLRHMAIERLENGDVMGFLCAAPNHYGVELVVWNWFELQKRGLLEIALREAFNSTRGNNRYWIPELRAM